MIVIRIIGLAFLALAFAVLVFGGVVWLGGADLHQAAGQYWFSTHAESLTLSQAVVQRYLNPWLWEVPVVEHLLRRPLWEALTRLFVVLALVGALLATLARRRRGRRGARF